MDFFILIAGFVLLIKWADYLVDWASSVAKKYWISSLVIWLTIVAFWTSAPELVVNLFSAYWWQTQLALSNIIWSNISNIFLILWTTAFVFPIMIPHSTVKKEIPFLIFVSIVMFLLLLDWVLSRTDSLVLLTFFLWFLYYTFTIAKLKTYWEHWLKIKTLSSLKSSLYVFLGLSWLILWWKLIIYSAISIAESFWLPESFIWVTIVAIWTSLPELAASLMAAFKKNTDMAIWWVIGSNIFNILWILWITWFIHPLEWYDWMLLDSTVQLISCILVFILAYTFWKNFLNKYEWFVLFSLYIMYISYLSIWVL